MGGILSLPYQFYHHRVCVLCDRDRSEKKNLFDTDRHGVRSLLTMQTIIYCDNPGHAGPHHHATLHTHINALSSFAVVMIGKGLTRQVLTQIDPMVSNGNVHPDHTKCTK